MTNDVQNLFEQRLSRKYGILKWVGAILLAVLAGPLIWMALTAVVGAALMGIATFITFCLGLAAIHFWGVFTVKVKNKKLEMMRAEAAKNPIETLLNGWIEEAREIDQLRMDHINSVADTGSYADQARQLAPTLTPEDIKEYEDDVVLMRAGDQKDEEVLLGLQEAHAKKKQAIDRLSSKWKMAMSLKARNERDMARGRANAIQEIMNDAALQSIQREYNVGKASLQVRMAERRNKTAAISNDPSNPITFNSVVDVQAKVAIPR